GERVKWENSKRIVKHGFLLMLLLWGTVEVGYGQRVYADAQQSSEKQSLILTFSEVINQENAIDENLANFSTLLVRLGALGAITANQNLQFINQQKPLPTSPIVIRFGSTNSLLNLLGGFSVQRTNGGRTSLIGPSYSGGELLNLLNLLGQSQVDHAIIPPSGEEYDGIRLEINTFLGGLLEAYYYYAFYITPPTIPHITLCEGVRGQ